jgi:hypothetical protein
MANKGTSAPQDDVDGGESALQEDAIFAALAHNVRFARAVPGHGKGKQAATEKEAAAKRGRTEDNNKPASAGGEGKAKKSKPAASAPKKDAAGAPAAQPFQPIKLIIIDDDGQGQGDAEYDESVTITEKMLTDLLQYGAWTSDEMINGYLALLQSEVKRGIVLEHTYIQEQVLGSKKCNLDAKIAMCKRKWADAAAVLMPVFIHGNHWALMEGALWIYESRPQGKMKEDMALWEKIGWFVNEVFETHTKWVITYMDCPTQVCDDCGPFMLCAGSVSGVSSLQRVAEPSDHLSSRSEPRWRAKCAPQSLKSGNEL